MKQVSQEYIDLLSLKEKYEKKLLQCNSSTKYQGTLEFIQEIEKILEKNIQCQ